MLDYNRFFKQVIGRDDVDPLRWQVALAENSSCESRLIRIPTGFGKTLGVVSAWLWNRIYRNDEGWPRRLLWCLPMRVLVEQTEAEVRAALLRLGKYWANGNDHADKVGVHLLMGGADAGEWHLHPEHAAVLIGTQDMLLSRALNRGYGSARARWPMDFGLLNQDSLWVMDEVQLMDVGLATSGQLQAFRQQDRTAGRTVRPSYTWWMSATLQRAWLEKSPETKVLGAAFPETSIPPDARTGLLWETIDKPVVVEKAQDAKTIAKLVVREHIQAGKGQMGPTLVVLNRVEEALDVHTALERARELQTTHLLLVHSRFRPHERAKWREEFLNRACCVPGTDRVIVATQVVEAGVDISTAVLVTALAPWPSLVQRFGRAARWGGSARIIVADQLPKDDKAALPYSKHELDGAREALSHLADVAPLSLEVFEETHSDLLPALYPYAPRHLLLRHELDELFDITPDLSGADVDISRFIRSGEERDLQVFWQDIAKEPDRRLRPAGEALCPVPFLKARDWLCGDTSQLKKGIRAWVWDWIDGVWRRLERRDLYPGQTVLVSSSCGGYDTNRGWSPDSGDYVAPVPEPEVSPDELADSSQDDEALSFSQRWQTIAVHGAFVGRRAAEIASVLFPDRAALLNLAGRWHDAGKAHKVFQNSIVASDRPARRDLAKAPEYAWLKPSQLYPDPESNGRRRGGFRHELASTLALFAILERHQPDHPALLAPWRLFLEAAGLRPAPWRPPAAVPNDLEKEILGLAAEDFDLLAYLVCAHHGKVRQAWHASPSDQEANDGRLRIRGVRDGEELPQLTLTAIDGSHIDLPASTLHLALAGAGLNPLTGKGWTERVLGLLERHGPFTLAWLEALLRAADQRASRELIADPLLDGKESP